MFLAEFNWVDWAIVTFVAFSLVVSFVRGFVREALSLAAWILSLWVAMSFYTIVAGYLAPHVEVESLRMTISFVILFAAIFIASTVINYVILQFIQDSGLRPTDRVFGLAFGAGRGILIICLLIIVGAIFSMQTAQWWTDSVLIVKLKPMVLWIQAYLPENMQVPF